VEAVGWDLGTPLPRGPTEGECTWGGGTSKLRDTPPDRDLKKLRKCKSQEFWGL